MLSMANLIFTLISAWFKCEYGMQGLPLKHTVYPEE